MYDPYADFSKHVLANGLEVHSVFWDRPWVIAEIVIHSGGREDPASLPGLAHFVEHIVSRNIPDWEPDSMEEFFEERGGSTELGITSYTATRYGFRIPATEAVFRDALAIFGSMLFQARLEKEIERERKVIQSEFNGRYPFAESLEWDMALRKSLFKGHRLETWNRALGRPEGFLAAQETDLQGFYDTHYVPRNASLAIVGGLREDQVISALQESPFGAERGGFRNAFLQPFGLPPVPEERVKIVKMSDYTSLKADWAEYSATWAIPAGFSCQARRIFTSMLNKILFDEVRQKRGLAYSIAADYTSFQDIYEYRISARINPDATSYIGELVQECISSVPSMRSLFERTRAGMLQRCSMMDLSGRRLADYAAEDLAVDHRILLMEEVRNELLEVAFEQIAEAAASLSPERRYAFVMQP